MDFAKQQLNFQALTKTDSDRYVCNEIFGIEDAYRRLTLIPYLRGADVIEIGAHKGYFTLLAGSVSARVVAFEPDRENFDFLKQNIALNGMTHVTAVNRAVMSAAGPRTFTVSAITAARHTFYPSEFSGQQEIVEVQCTTLPDILRDYTFEHVDVLKMDCEGSEYDILLNCGAETFSKIDHIVLELHETAMIRNKKSELVEHLARFGFKADIYDERVMGPMHLWMGWFAK